MKKLFAIFTPIAIGILLTISVFAQSPEKMSYQAVIRNSSNDLVKNTQIGMEINIRQGSPTGTVVYSETQTPTTNANGLISIEIGGGAGFNAIDWSEGPYFIETKTDPTGGTNYTITATSQFLSVPYALYAKTAETAIGGITETDPVFTAWDKNYNDLTNKPIPWDSSYNSLKNKPTAISDFTLNANSQNITNLADPVNAQDAATKAYVDLLKSQIEAMEINNLILWNKLGSTEEVQNSVIGPNGTIVGSVNFNNTVKFGKGITPNTGNAQSGVDFPTTVVNPERGCVEMWVKFYYVPVAYSYGVYGFINVAHWNDNVIGFYWHNDGSLLQFILKFNGTGRSVDLTGFTPTLNTPIHIACVWDRTGIDGTSEYMRIYVNGVKVAANNTNNDWGTDNTSGNFRVAAPWDSNFSTDRYSVDNIKVWNYAKTTFNLNKE